ncbi:MAG: RnfABCDGE type electron transport complex subunit B [Clostridia bacterium]|nr:RnfABCDGE type electron transport complex subunit B [Clostridia bacterium]
MNNFLAQVNTGKLFTVLAVIAVLSILFALLIVTVSKLCAVKEDGRIEEIKDKLANANCGGCGFAGCAEFAKAVAEGRANIDDCGPTSPESKKRIAEILGIEYAGKKVAAAKVHCSGGDNCTTLFNYVGNQTCSALSVFNGGNKGCIFGCLGCGDCKDACEYGAITMENGVSTINEELCVACGKCVKACPRNLISFLPKDGDVYIGCSSKHRGKDVMNVCKKGCIGCGLCAKNCPEGAITMEDNLPVIDYAKCTGCLTCVEKCPRKCIIKG